MFIFGESFWLILNSPINLAFLSMPAGGPYTISWGRNSNTLMHQNLYIAKKEPKVDKASKISFSFEFGKIKGFWLKAKRILQCIFPDCLSFCFFSWLKKWAFIPKRATLCVSASSFGGDALTSPIVRARARRTYLILILFNVFFSVRGDFKSFIIL